VYFLNAGAWRVQSIPYELFLLLIRIAFLFLLYFFLFQLMRVISSDIRVYSGEKPTSPPAKSRLVVIDPGTTRLRTGVALRLLPVTSLGRRPSNVIVLEDEYVSGEHALLAWRNGTWWLSDVASTNGTFLNGNEVEESTQVSNGDIISLGRVMAKLES
jgi:hypothetical protein